MVFACEKFKVFILGYLVNALIDHHALMVLFCCRLAEHCHYNNLILRVLYIIGPENIVESLFRNPIDQNDTNTNSVTPYILVTIS